MYIKESAIAIINALEGLINTIDEITDPDLYDEIEKLKNKIKKDLEGLND